MGMREEYSPEHFKDAVRGKYADRFEHAGVKVVLDPEVAAVFGDDAAVNEALRTLMRLQAAAPTRAVGESKAADQ